MVRVIWGKLSGSKWRVKMARPNCLLLILNVLGWHLCELVLWLSFQWMSWLGYAEVPHKPLHFSDLALRVVLTTERCWVGVQVWEAAVHYVLFSNADSSLMGFIIPENPRSLFPVSRRGKCIWKVFKGPSGRRARSFHASSIGKNLVLWPLLTQGRVGIVAQSCAQINGEWILMDN